MRPSSGKHFFISQLGFTLIELLSVIAIIGVLAAILIPTAVKVGAATNNTKCLSNLRQLGVAAKLYSMNDPQQTNPTGTTWHNELLYYLDFPDSISTLSDLQKVSPETAQSLVLWCPSVDFDDAHPIAQRDKSCYGINVSYYASLHEGNSDPNRRRTAFDTGLHASKIIAFLDANNRNVFHSTPSRIGTGRHEGTVNVVFADGHAESVFYNGDSSTLDPNWRVLFDGPSR